MPASADRQNHLLGNDPVGWRGGKFDKSHDPCNSDPMTRAVKESFLTVRVTGESLRQLQELAKRNERTVAGEVRIAISERLEREANDEETV